MGSIFLDDGVDELLRGGSAAQQAYAALELRHEWHRVPDQVPSLDRCVPHLPTCKFPDKSQGKKRALTPEPLSICNRAINNNSKTVLITAW